MLLRTSLIFVIGSLLAVSSRQETRTSATHTIAPGIELIQETVPLPEGPLTIHVLRIDPKAHGLTVRAELGRDVVMANDPTKGREEIGLQAQRLMATAAINADFFPYTGDPLGLMVRNRELISESLPHRAAFGFTKDGKAVFGRVTVSISGLAEGDPDPVKIDGINRTPGENEVVLLNPIFANKLSMPAGTLGVGLEGGETVTLKGKTNWHIRTIDPEFAEFTGKPGLSVLAARGPKAEALSKRLEMNRQFTITVTTSMTDGGAPAIEWDSVSQAVGGGPWLVRDGQAFDDGAAERFNERTFVQARHPRTAVGVTESGKLLWVVVDGRQQFSKGVTLPELASIMLRLGAKQAINLDGGGSSEMSAMGLTVNGPSDGRPRPVSNGLFVYSKDRVPSAPETVGEQSSAKVGIPFSVPISKEPGTKWYGTVEGTAYVSPEGRVFPRAAGTLTVVRNQTGKAERFVYRVDPSTSAPPRSR